jgi:hypothetical protein
MPYSRGRSNPGQGSGSPRYPGTFLLALREAAAGLGWQVQRSLGAAVVFLDADRHERTVGLDNLYREARRVPREEWPGLMAEFLAAALAAEGEADLPKDLASVGERLLVRVGRPLVGLPEGLRTWAQPIAGTDFVQNLVIDYPHSMSYVTEELVADSGKPAAVWLERALANLRDRTPDDAVAVIHEPSGLRLCAVGDAYDSARVLLLDALLPENADLGSFVALPCRDELLVLPVTAPGFAQIHLLHLLAAKSFASDPYPISEQVYWVRGGVWHPFGIEVGEKNVNVRPPPEFLTILERISPPGERKAEDGPQ